MSSANITTERSKRFAIFVIAVSAAWLVAIVLTVDASNDARTFLFGISQCILLPFFAGQVARQLRAMKTKDHVTYFLAMVGTAFFALASIASACIIMTILMGFRY